MKWVFPAKDLLHLESPISKAWNFPANSACQRTRPRAERHKPIMEGFGDLDLTHRKNVQISGLSAASRSASRSVWSC